MVGCGFGRPRPLRQIQARRRDEIAASVVSYAQGGVACCSNEQGHTRNLNSVTSDLESLVGHFVSRSVATQRWAAASETDYLCGSFRTCDGRSLGDQR